MWYVGIDPDLHCTGIVVVDGNAKMLHAQCVKISKKLIGRDACVEMSASLLNAVLELPGQEYGAFAVEAQELYRGGSSATENPRSIMFLGPVSGAGLAGAKRRCPLVDFPAPMAWKGNAPKHIHQARQFARAGMACVQVLGEKRNRQKLVTTGYCHPVQSTDMIDWQKRCKINCGDWKHLSDALGLAYFAMDAAKKKQSKDAFIQSQGKTA